jgi:hypothetical protein
MSIWTFQLIRRQTVERVNREADDSPTVAEWVERWIRTEKGAAAVVFNPEAANWNVFPLI